MQCILGNNNNPFSAEIVGFLPRLQLNELPVHLLSVHSDHYCFYCALRGVKKIMKCYFRGDRIGLLKDGNR